MFRDRGLEHLWFSCLSNVSSCSQVKMFAYRSQCAGLAMVKEDCIDWLCLVSVIV